MKYAVKHHIYRSLLVGNKTERALAKEKTHNRQQHRARKNIIIGLPEEGRASASKVITWHSYQKQNPHLTVFDQRTAWEALPGRKVRKSRIDPKTRKVITWHRFKKKFERLSHTDRWAKWKTLPRRKTIAMLRDFNGSPLSWLECIAQYRDYWEMRDISNWFRNLPKIS